MIVALLMISQIIGSLAQTPTTAQTVYGPVIGELQNGVRSFKGIPYAAPPVGNLRWESPQEPKSWGPTPKKAVSWQPGCPQDCDLPPHTCPPAFSEDCLFLNVFTSENANKLPVMVWLHGGHFDQGSAGCDLYDGTTVVQTGNVVMVTLSYRLGVLGWLATFDGLTGNYGFQDQLLALKWVQRNIANFGGDPGRVTLFGQSAGGTSLRAHLVSPHSKGLFHAAISHSDPVTLPMQPIIDAQNWGQKFLADIGCPDSACLRTKNTSVIIAAQKIAEKHIDIGHPLESFLPLTPLVDNKWLPMHIFDAVRTGQLNRVPLMIGSTSQDALLFVFKGIKDFLNSVQYVGIVTAVFHQHVFTVLEQYPPEPFIGDKRPELAILGTDYIFSCPIRSMIANYVNSTSGRYPVWLWQWNHALSWDGWGPGYPYCNGKVCHGADIPFLFRPPVVNKYANMTQDEKYLSDQMIRYWTNFAKNADPNVGMKVDVNWPQWNPQTLQNIELQTPKSVVTSRLLSDACDFWDPLGYHWGW